MNIGDKIPEIIGVDQDGNTHTREQYSGKKLLLYFYPKDNTSGCTAQACSLRDGIARLKAAGYEILGVSKDSAKSHKKFIETHQLPFPLIVDEEVKLNQLFDTWKEKSMYGRKYMGTERTSFVINEEGVIERIIRGKQVNTKEHADQILNDN